MRGAIRVVFRQRSKQLRHPGRHPSVPPAPEERDIGGVIEQAIRLLELVEVHRHLESRAVQILLVARRAISLHLQDRDHVHIVDPEARFACEPLRVGRQPLPVGKSLSQVEVLRLPGLE